MLHSHPLWPRRSHCSPSPCRSRKNLLTNHATSSPPLLVLSYGRKLTVILLPGKGVLGQDWNRPPRKVVTAPGLLEVKKRLENALKTHVGISRQPCVQPGVRHDDSHGSPPTWGVLWFHGTASPGRSQNFHRSVFIRTSNLRDARENRFVGDQRLRQNHKWIVKCDFLMWYLRKDPAWRAALTWWTIHQELGEAPAASWFMQAS